MFELPELPPAAVLPQTKNVSGDGGELRVDSSLSKEEEMNIPIWIWVLVGVILIIVIVRMV